MTIWCPQIERASGPRYLAIVEALGEDIASGRLDEGERLPTHRELATALGVSIGTVTRAYAAAERRGLVRGETGRGTFVGPARTEALPVGDTGERVSGGVNLSMTWPLDVENPDLSRALRTLSKRHDLGDLLRYQPNAGMLRHREAGARWIATYGLDVDPADVAVCNGSQHAMTVVLSSVARPGDTILTGELTYPGIRAVADCIGLRLAGLAMDDEGILPEALEEACKRRISRVLYCIPSLQNPTTATMSNERREAIAKIARRHDVTIVEDAIHHRLLEDPPLPIASFAPECTHFIGAPSKVVAGGLRIGFLASPRSFVDRVSANIWAISWMTAPLLAEIFATWLEDGTAEATVERKRAEARARVQLARERLAGHGLRVPDVAYHAWLDLPDTYESASRLVEDARRRGVVVTSGEAFRVGNGSAPSGVRLSLSAPPSRALLDDGLRRLTETLADAGRGPGPVIV